MKLVSIPRITTASSVATLAPVLSLTAIELSGFIFKLSSMLSEVYSIPLLTVYPDKLIL
jgi:hypothetical protein